MQEPKRLVGMLDQIGGEFQADQGVDLAAVVARKIDRSGLAHGFMRGTRRLEVEGDADAVQAVAGAAEGVFQTGGKELRAAEYARRVNGGNADAHQEAASKRGLRA